MHSAVIELSIDKLLAQARASVDEAASNQQAAQEAFERKKGSCGTQEFVSLKGALDQANAILSLRTSEFARAEADYFQELQEEGEEFERKERIARRKELTKGVEDLTAKMSKVQMLLRELPGQLERLSQERNLLLAQLCQITEVN